MNQTLQELIENIEANGPDEMQIRVNSDLLNTITTKEAFNSMRDRLARDFVISRAEVKARIEVFESSLGVRFAKTDIANRDADGVLAAIEGTPLEGLLPENDTKWKRISHQELEFEVLPNSPFAAAWAIAQETLEAIGCRVFSYPNDDKRYCRINFELFS